MPHSGHRLKSIRTSLDGNKSFVSCPAQRYGSLEAVIYRPNPPHPPRVFFRRQGW
jgi:hypothetical protein